LTPDEYPEWVGKLYLYLRSAHPGFNKRDADEPEVKKLWYAALVGVRTYARGHAVIGEMLNVAKWPALPEFHAAAKRVPEQRNPTDDGVSPEEVREAKAMKQAWLALPKEQRDGWRAATMREWGVGEPRDAIGKVLVNGHARISWWTAEGRAANYDGTTATEAEGA